VRVVIPVFPLPGDTHYRFTCWALCAHVILTIVRIFGLLNEKLFITWA